MQKTTHTFADLQRRLLLFVGTFLTFGSVPLRIALCDGQEQQPAILLILGHKLGVKNHGALRVHEGPIQGGPIQGGPFQGGPIQGGGSL